jgi:hypothetical protein
VVHADIGGRLAAHIFDVDAFDVLFGEGKEINKRTQTYFNNLIGKRIYET